MIISLLQEKGGSGKTTITVNLAKAIQDLGYSVLVVDSDKQGSARDWHLANDGITLEMVGLDRPTIDKDIRKFINEYDFILIDGAPQLSSMIAKIIVISDLILIPVQPSPYDVWACEDLVELIKQRQEITGSRPYSAFIISRCIKNTNIGIEVKNELGKFNLPILNNRTYQRIAYPVSSASGKTVLEIPKYEAASQEIKRLAQEILNIKEANEL